MTIAEPPQTYLVVRVAERRVALPVAQVEEICRSPELEGRACDLPGLLGFATLRGAPTPVIDPAVLLGWTKSASAPGAEEFSANVHGSSRLVRVLMAETLADRSAPRAALLVDEVLGVYAIRAETVRTVALPGGSTEQLGLFDHRFARLMDASGLIDSVQWQQIQAAVQS